MGTYQFHSVFLYIRTCIHGYLASFLPILCATGSVACITMPRLYIVTTRRVVFLKNTAGYLVHKIINYEASDIDK